MWCGCHDGAWYQVSPETMSSRPSLSTSKTPAASNSLRPLIVCCFHLGSSARTDVAAAKATIVQAAKRARECVMGSLRVAPGRVGNAHRREAIVGGHCPPYDSPSDGGERPGLAVFLGEILVGR